MTMIEIANVVNSNLSKLIFDITAATIQKSHKNPSLNYQLGFVQFCDIYDDTIWTEQNVLIGPVYVRLIIISVINHKRRRGL